jgi:hypothetical protein
LVLLSTTENRGTDSNGHDGCRFWY